MLWLSMSTSPIILTLDFQGQILKKSYLMNGMADWHGMKGMWFNRMLDPCCDFQCSPLPWPWPWIFKVKFWKGCISGMGWPINMMERKGCESIECDFKLGPHPWPSPWIFKVKYWNCCNSGMGGSTHLRWKGCELDMMLDAQWDWPWATLHGK